MHQAGSPRALLSVFQCDKMISFSPSLKCSNLHQDHKGVFAGSLANHMHRMAQKHLLMTPAACSASWTAPRQSLRLVTPLPGSTRYKRSPLYGRAAYAPGFSLVVTCGCCQLKRLELLQITSLFKTQDTYLDILPASPKLQSWDYCWTFSSSKRRRAGYGLMATRFGAGSCQAAEGQGAGCPEGGSCCSG